MLRTAPVLRAVVFDMDGVIVDSHPAHKSAWREFLHAIGKEVRESDLEFVMDGRKREEILVHFLGQLDQSQLRRYGNMKNDFFCRATSEVLPIAGAFEFIKSLHREGIPIGVATSASGGRTEFTLRRLGLLHFFHTVVTGDEVPRGKPDPSIYRLACQRINCAPETAVAVEDAASGVRAAKAAGLHCVAIGPVQREQSLLAAGADRIYEDFTLLTVQHLQSLVSRPGYLPCKPDRGSDSIE